MLSIRYSRRAYSLALHAYSLQESLLDPVQWVILHLSDIILLDNNYLELHINM